MHTLRSALILGASVLLSGLIVHAQATRTWISGVGDDANPCSRTAPCKTFAGAISKTATGGEIDNLDTGGFGALTITKSITLDGGGGQVASILVSGTPGITVNAPGSIVVIRNISFQGTAGSGTVGISIVAAAVVHIEHCVILGFSGDGIGINVSAGTKVFVDDTTSQDNGGDGLDIVDSVSEAVVNVSNSHFNDNLNGIYSGDNSNTAVQNSEASGNSQAGFIAIGNLAPAKLSIVNSMAGNDNTGITAGGGNQAASVRVASTALFSNPGGGFTKGNNGTISSFGNNYNAGAGTPSGSITPQ